MTVPTLSPAETRALFPDQMTMLAARMLYFERSGFDEKTYTDTFVRLPVGPLVLLLPNFPARRRAVKVHDLDHTITGYGSDWTGEVEISAFELGMGHGPYWVGYFINAGGVFVGLLRAPRRVFAAYARGRATRRSLYEIFAPWDDALLQRTVGAVRAEVGLPDAAPVTTRDAVGAVTWAVVGALSQIGPLLVAGGALWWLASTLLNR
jgi:hypothetical protein